MQSLTTTTSQTNLSLTILRFCCAVNECTHLARQTEQWLPGAGPAPVRLALLRWLRAFPLALMDHLRQEDSLESLVKG